MPKTIWFIKKGVCNCSRNERRTKTSEKKGKMMRDSAKKKKKPKKKTRGETVTFNNFIISKLKIGFRRFVP